MELHEREALTTDAGIALMNKLTEWASEWAEKLTYYEYIQVILQESRSLIGTAIKYAIRIERHGDTEKCGGLKQKFEGGER